MILRGLALLLMLLAGGPLDAASPALGARPAASAPGLAPGRTALSNGAIAYLPATARARPVPLIVLLHGYAGNAERFLERFVPSADRGGFMLLALQSKGATWDLVPRRDGSGGPLAMKSGPSLRFGADVARIDTVLSELFARTTVDTKHIVLLGFSDGASYALSLGLANPQLFRTIVALSPGFVVIPTMVAPSQQVFIGHGRQDQVLPFRVAEKDIVGLIVANGLKPQFRAFDGDHRIDDAELADALAFALGPAKESSGL